MLALLLTVLACAPSAPSPAPLEDVVVEPSPAALATEAAAAAARARAHEAEVDAEAARAETERRARHAASRRAAEPQVEILRGGDVGTLGRDRTLRPFSGATWLQGRAGDDGDLLVVFWQPWCPACRSELPKLQQWGGGGRVQVVAVTSLSKHATEAQAEAVLATAGFTGPAAVVPSSTFDAVDVPSYPYAVLLRDRRIAWKGHPADARRRIASLLQ
jgi:thiol-disulfide isomerase/thioredoxin